MPELPEVQALVDFLAERTAGLPVTKVELASFSVLKTFNPPPQALEGAPVDGVHRHGKFLDIDAAGTHLVFHLARPGWLRWSDQLPAALGRPGEGGRGGRTRRRRPWGAPASRRTPCACACPPARASTRPRPARRSRSPP